MKWSSILKNKRTLGDLSSMPGTFAFHSWIRQAIAENKPYDQIRRAEIVGAREGDAEKQPRRSSGIAR